MVNNFISTNEFDEDEDFLDEQYDYLFRPKKQNSRKSLAPLFVYLILKEKSSPEKPFTQKKLLDMLERDPYGISIERKALSRIIHGLEDSGFGIVNKKNIGVWYDSDAEWGNTWVA